MLRVTLRGSGIPTVVLGAGDTLLMGRAPDAALPVGDAQVNVTALALPQVAPHVSRVIGDVQVGDEVVRLRWRGSTSAQLSSLFDAPGGARRVSLSDGMAALLDEGENQLLLFRGRQQRTGRRDEYTDMVLTLDVEEVDAAPGASWAPEPAAADADATAAAPQLERLSREWYVALALAEPWLSGADDYPRPPSNREIYERVLDWRGHAWNLERAQRVDDAIRSVARLAFGPADDPFTASEGRVQNVRFAVGRRIAELGFVTMADLQSVLVAQARGNGIHPDDPTG